ncbi:hypothetical protein [Kitasatospora sp. Root107]|uniref:hypothetical protein n=1 Tax=Kitasatospora sp. Root107 TaxID=1736424 RepID=UPI000AC107CA|nr:hypothetical protein [Kitasatospora sp. Root107]
MYLSSVRVGAAVTAAPARRILTGNVLALGLVSLVTDVSAEMVSSVLPAYLVLGLHLTVSQYGMMDGLFTGATALTRVAGGYAADRFRRRKLPPPRSAPCWPSTGPARGCAPHPGTP